MEGASGLRPDRAISPLGLAITGKIHVPLSSGTELSAPIPRLCLLQSLRDFRYYPLRVRAAAFSPCKGG
jgi:hypothetical protein